MVFADRTLGALTGAQPTTEAALLEVKGIGPAKLETYGEQLLAMVAVEEIEPAVG